VLWYTLGEINNRYFRYIIIPLCQHRLDTQRCVDTLHGIYKRGISDTPIFLAIKTANWLRSSEHSMCGKCTPHTFANNPKFLLTIPLRITVCRELCIVVAHSGAIGLVSCECDFFCYYSV